MSEEPIRAWGPPPRGRRVARWGLAAWILLVGLALAWTLFR